MQKLISLTLLLFFSNQCFAASSSYQVDLILFVQPKADAMNHDFGLNTPFMPIAKTAIALTSSATQSAKRYQLLSFSKSSLRNQYYLLNRKHRYQILGHYSWIQPGTSSKSVILPTADSNGWQMQGTVRIRKSNYYLFDTDLQLSPPSNPELTYTINRKQRLKEDVVYYLDHPQLGILIKVHQIT